ncbi:MAG: PAS domain S-box protein [Candidatus Margulisbacteria bacterium]|nr:PAS domain S-box protein [Candidatus Margulisiibacteriota bacterium]
MYKLFTAWLIFLYGAFLFQFIADVAILPHRVMIFMKISDILWLVSTAFLLHAVMLFFNQPLIKKKTVLLLIYLLPLVSVFLLFMKNIGYVSAVETPYGKDFIANPFYVLFSWSSAIYALLAILVCFMAFLQNRDRLQKIQSLLLGLAFILPLAADIIAEILVNYFNLNLPMLITPAYMISVAVLLIAALIFNLFPKYPEFAAETIFAHLPDILLVTDLDGKINLVTDSYLKLSGLQQKDILFSPLSQAIENEKQAAEILQKVLTQGQKLQDYALPYRNKIFSVYADRITDNTSTVIGLTIIGRDATERKNNEKELQTDTVTLGKSLEEIDQVNQQLIERELQMVNLKNEIASLKTRLQHG